MDWVAGRCWAYLCLFIENPIQAIIKLLKCLFVESCYIRWGAQFNGARTGVSIAISALHQSLLLMLKVQYTRKYKQIPIENSPIKDVFIYLFIYKIVGIALKPPPTKANTRIGNNIVNMIEWLPECQKTVNIFVNMSIHGDDQYYCQYNLILTILFNVYGLLMSVCLCRSSISRKL